MLIGGSLWPMSAPMCCRESLHYAKTGVLQPALEAVAAGSILIIRMNDTRILIRFSQCIGCLLYTSEFDQFLDGGNYYGLDKFSLDASFQDNSYMKTYMAYDMMAFMEVPTPLCSYAWVTVNGEDWGFCLLYSSRCV